MNSFDEFVTNWRAMEELPDNSEVRLVCACGDHVKHTPLSIEELQEMFLILNEF